MKRMLWLSLGMALLLATGLTLSSCVRPRETPAPVPTKMAAGPTPTRLPSTPLASSPTARPTGAGVAQATPATATALPGVTSTAPQPTVAQTPATPTIAQVTPAPTATAMATAAPAGGEVTYEVRWGDNLSRIAQRFGTTVSAIMASNPRITNPNRIYPGMVLVIASGSGQGPVPTAAPAETTAAPTGPTVHVVQAGDTLSAIARRYGTTEAAIIAANRGLIRNRNLIMRGWRLTIPSPSGGSTTPSDGRTYRVARGDTVSGIARRFGTTVWEIVVRNNLSNANLIYPGQTLIIP